MCFCLFRQVIKENRKQSESKRHVYKKKLHRDVTTERVKAKKAMNIGERNKYMARVQTSPS